MSKIYLRWSQLATPKLSIVYTYAYQPVDTHRDSLCLVSCADFCILDSQRAVFFFGMIWSVWSKWIDPRTAAKLITVPSTLTLATLVKTIDMDHIPIKYGGSFNFEHGMLPKVDEAMRQSLTLSGEGILPAGPIKLAENPRGEMSAAGATDGKKRQDVIGHIVERP